MTLILDMATGREYRSDDSYRTDRPRDMAAQPFEEPRAELQLAGQVTQNLADELPEAVRALYRRVLIDRAD